MTYTETRRSGFERARFGLAGGVENLDRGRGGGDEEEQGGGAGSDGVGLAEGQHCAEGLEVARGRGVEPDHCRVARRDGVEGEVCEG